MLFCSCTVLSGADPPAAKPPEWSIRVPYGESLQKVVGRSGEPFVTHAAVVTSFLQRQPRDGAPASRPTAAYLSYDDKNLYVVFVCDEDPALVRAHLAKREEISDDDSVSLYLDTFADRQRAYQFSVNPLGVQRDSILTEGQPPDTRFDTLWHSEGRLTSSGYIVWMAIPFKSLRFPSQAAQSWRIALSRYIPRNNETSFWPYISLKQQGFIPQMGVLEGIENVSPGRNVQLIPYFTGAEARLLDYQTARYPAQRDFRGGIDGKIVARNALTIDLTANPDFSQVESDDPQVTVNQRYEVFFPEKRPFFIENAGFFETPVNLFYSRRIIDPQFGARLSSKLGRWAIGALGMDDRAEGKRLPQSSPNYRDHAVIGVARIQREFARESRIGAFASSREFAGSYNRMASLDARLRLSPTWVLTGQAAQSYDRRLDGTRRHGPAYLAELSHGSEHFTYAGSYLDVSPDFRAPLGFVRRTDIRQTQHYAGYFWRPEGGKVLSYGPAFTAGWNWRRDGRLQDRYFNSEFNMDFAGPTGFKLSRYDAYELYLNHGFRYARHDASFYTAVLRWLFVYGSFGEGKGINYNPAYGTEPHLALARNASFGLTFRPTPRTRVEQSYFYSWLGDRDPASKGASLFTNHLFRTKVNYQFTRALSVRAILDYYALLPDSSRINESKAKFLTGDVLLTWLLNPGTAFYIGYNRRYENLLIQPHLRPAVTPSSGPLDLSGHQVFVKLSYLLRF